jgi:hypothetical protein
MQRDEPCSFDDVVGAREQRRGHVGGFPCRARAVQGQAAATATSLRKSRRLISAPEGLRSRE